MNLKVLRTTKNKVVTIVLETTCFNEDENAMLDQLGEPIISMCNSYGNNAINFSKKIRSNFRVKVKFDANLENDTDKTADFVDQFMDDVKELLSEAMSQLSDEYNEDLISKEEIINIKY